MKLDCLVHEAGPLAKAMNVLKEKWKSFDKVFVV